MPDFKASQIPNDVILLDISGGMTSCRGDVIGFHFEVATAGNIQMLGQSEGAVAIDVPFDVGTYDFWMRLEKIGPGAVGGAVLNKAGTVYQLVSAD